MAPESLPEPHSFLSHPKLRYIQRHMYHNILPQILIQLPIPHAVLINHRHIHPQQFLQILMDACHSALQHFTKFPLIQSFLPLSQAPGASFSKPATSGYIHAARNSSILQLSHRASFPLQTA